MPSRTRDQPMYADDSGSDDEIQVPRHSKVAQKRRISEPYAPDEDSDTGGRQPLRAVNINDDAAEKRRRRKSTKVFNNPAESEVDITRTAARARQQLNTVAQPALDNMKIAVQSDKFEEWMKLATDNKINAANSWNVALIDYFHDMSLLRNGDDNSINFQHASCTLDGCIKIWTSRVDSVGTEAAKLASNLAAGGSIESDNEDLDENGDDEAVNAKKKKTHRAVATLAKDPSQLRSKKLDLEFSVDPLFRKTCADFDEGGAQGLLMNHLSLGTNDTALTIIFDAGDVMGQIDEGDNVEEPVEMIDISAIREQFLQEFDGLEERAISHSLEGFSFTNPTGTSGIPLYADSGEADIDDDYMDAPMQIDPEVPPMEEEDFFVGDNAVMDDFVADGYGDNFGGDHISAGSPGAEMVPGGTVPFDPRRLTSEKELVLAMSDNMENNVMDYFDKTFMKNWAGPEHWKMRRVIRKPLGGDADGQKATRSRKEKKEAFRIDFLSQSGKSLDALEKELFAVGKSGSINMPKAGSSNSKSKKKAKKTKKSDNLLPDDMHFSSRQLVTLFLKPKFSLKMRGHLVPAGDAEVDENFWAQPEGGDGNNQDDNNASMGLAFDTQFFNEDFDDAPGFEDGFDVGTGGATVDAGEQDLLAATSGQTRRVRPETVNYAKRAKRVDVRKLKDNIWKGLDIVVSSTKEPEDMDVDGDDPGLTDPTEARQFSTVIDGLQASYPPEKMSEISTSFCFICLLHLANEQGLKILSQAEATTGGDRPIGDIWDLNISRDPNATQSA